MFDFGNHLKNLRLSKHLTQKQLAENIGASESGIQNYELGTRKPTYEMLIKLANYFDISLDYLTGRNDNPDSHWMTLEWQKDFNNIMGAMIQAEAIKIKSDKERKQ